MDLWEPRGEIPRGHPTCCLLRQGTPVTAKDELIDAEKALPRLVS